MEHRRHDIDGASSLPEDNLCNFSYDFGGQVVDGDSICPAGRRVFTAMRNKLDDEKIEPTGLDFQHNSGLSSVYCHANAIGDNGVGIQALFRALDGYSAVTRLNLEHCCLGPRAAATLAGELQRFDVIPNLATLALGCNCIGPQGGMELSELIKSGKVHHSCIPAIHNIPEVTID